MKLKTLKIFREDQKMEDIGNSLKNVTQEKYNSNTIDSILERKVDLLMDFSVRGIEWNLKIPTYIYLEENELGTTIICKSTITKPFLLSLLIAIFAPVSFTFMDKDWTLYFILLSVFFIFVFGVFIIRTRLIAKDFLRELEI